MNNKKITGKQMQYSIILFILGSSLIVGATSEAKQDSWLSILIACAWVIPMIFVYNAILNKYPGVNFFDILTNVFGRIVGKIFCFLFTWFCIHLGSLVLSTFSEFILIANLSDTPRIAILTFFILLSVWMVNSGVENMGRIAKLAFPIVGFTVIATVILSLGQMNFNNILPVLSTDLKSITNAAFTTFSIPLCELSIFMALFSFVAPTAKGKPNEPKKIFIKGLLTATLFLLLTNLRNLFVLGVPLQNQFYFSSYQAVSVTSIGEFFTRFEVLTGINLLLACFIKLSALLFTSSIGLSKLFNIKGYKKMAAPCGLIMAFLSVINFSNTEEHFRFMKFFRVYTLPFEVILPIIIWIAIEIKTRIKKGDALPNPENTGSLE